MADQLLPENLASVLADLSRRVSALETAPRNGLHLLRQAWGTAAADPTSFAAWESGTVGNTWADDQGNTGTGYPQLTVTAGARVLIIATARPISIGSLSATYRSAGGEVGVGIDGGAPGTSHPTTKRAFGQGNDRPADNPVTWAVVRNVGAGTHTYQVSAYWNNSAPAAATLPRLTDVSLMILPLSAA